MRLRVWGVRIGRLMAVALILLVGFPARADTSVEGKSVKKAREAIEKVVKKAVSEMGEVVEELASEISELSTVSEIETSAASARKEVDDIRSDARKELDDLMKENPGTLDPDVKAAKDAIEQARHDARSDIDDLKESATEQLKNKAAGVAPPPPPPDPTPSPVPPPPPPASAIDGPGAASKETPPTTEGFRADIDPEPLLRALSTESAGRLFMVDAIPELTYTSASAGQKIEAVGAKTTSAIAQKFEVVLTPAVAELVLSPLLVIEILARTTLAGGWGNLVPLALLVAFTVLLVWADRRAKRIAQASATA